MSLVDRNGAKPVIWMEGQHKAISVRQPIISRLKYDVDAALVNKYHTGVVYIAKRCRKPFLPVWRKLRSQFNQKQLIGLSKGCMPSAEFVKIIQEMG